MKAYKGFNKDMTCRGFQFKEGETYHEDKAELCKSGFHACLDPIDCLMYYDPNESIYHEVELEDVDDKKENDSKICGKTIKIGAKIDIAGICKAHFEYVKTKIDKENEKSTTGDGSANSATGDGSANSATGYGSANSATGYRSANSATGDRSANSATGYGSANSATGDGSANSATGDRSANSATGDRSANSATGDGSANSATGYGSANSATGYGSANISTGRNAKNEAANGSISIGWGKDNICKGDIGSYIVLIERGEWDGEKYPQIGEPKLGKIDGVTLKPDTWYKLKDGEFVEVEKGGI